MGTSNTVIDDGYTRDDGYIAASKANEAGDRLYDALSFSYRPATRRQWIILDDQIARVLKSADADSIKIERMACEFVAKQVIRWDLKNRGGHEMPVNADSAFEMHAELFKQLYRIIRSERLSDVRPAVEKSEGESEKSTVAPPPSDQAMLGN